MLALWMCSTGALAQMTRVPEYQLKATFLFQFAQFVNWPREALPNPRTPITICTLGQDPFGDYLSETVRGEKVADHPLVFHRYARIEDAADCHLVFVSRSESSQLDRILSTLKNRKTLTIGDMDRFADRGGMIQFVTEENKVRLRINLEAARAANLTVSSKLLRLATLVGPAGD